MDNNLLSTPLDLDFKKNKIFYSHYNTPLLTEKTKSDLNNHYTNGLSNFIKKTRFEVITDVFECKNIWNQFSKNESLFDTWDFRYLFFKAYDTEPLFLTIKRGGEYLAVLPLMYQKIRNVYTWFGTDWMENNKFFAISKNYIPLLFYLAPKPMILEGINKLEIDNFPKFIVFEKGETNYSIPVKNFKSINEYLESLPKKRRYNLKRDFRRIESLNPIIVKNLKYKDKFFEMVIERMHERGEVPYFVSDGYNKTAFENLLNYNGNAFDVSLWTAIIDKEISVSDIVIEHDGNLYPLLGANNVTKFSGIGNYMNYYEIQNAFENKSEKIDFLQEDWGWKDKYLFKEVRYDVHMI